MTRAGAKKRPFYRVVVADSRKPRDGRFIERVGTYDPMLAKDNPDRVLLKEERIRYWLSVGAQPSDRVARFLGFAGILDKPTIPEQTKKNPPKAKAQERLKEAAEAAAAPPPPAPEPVEAEPVEAEAVEAEPVEAEPVEAEPVEAEPVEAEPVEAEPVEEKAAG